MSGPPTLLKIAAVVKYVKSKHGLEITRQTVYNWMAHGKKGTKLDFFDAKADPSSIYKTHRVTTQEKVDAFLSRSGLLQR